MITIKKFHTNKQNKIRIQALLPGNRYITRDYCPAEFEKLTQASTRTIQRWIKEGLPGTIQSLLLFSEIGLIKDPAFEGFNIIDGAIYTPAGHNIAAGQLESIAWTYQEARALRLRLKEKQAELDKARESIAYWRSQSGQIPAANDE